MNSNKLFVFCLLILSVGFTSCGDDDNEVPSKKYLSKLIVKEEGATNTEIYNFVYNQDNTLDRSNRTEQGSTKELYSEKFFYDANKRLIRVDGYNDGVLDVVHTYNYLDNNKVEYKVKYQSEFMREDNPIIYTLNPLGLPVIATREGLTIDGSLYPNWERRYTYNANNTVSISDEYLDYLHDGNSTKYAKSEFEYDLNTKNPFSNLPIGNLYFYDTFMYGIPLTGFGTFAFNCTMAKWILEEDNRMDTDKNTMVYEYSDDKFPIKARYQYFRDNILGKTYNITFEYISK